MFLIRSASTSITYKEFKQLLENDDYDGIYNEMNDTNRIREILKGIPLSK